jgi:hypothetical protein
LVVRSILTTTLHAQIPNVIPYQGSITDTSDVGFDGDFDFEFKILDASNTILWSSGTISVAVHNGNYSVSLGGSGQPAMARSIFDLDEVYLEISFDDGVTGKEVFKQTNSNPISSFNWERVLYIITVTSGNTVATDKVLKM